VEQEVNRLMQADYVVASNEVMAEWLRLQGFSKPLGALGFFDYRSHAATSTPARSPMGSAAAARLCRSLGCARNAFLLELQDRIARLRDGSLRQPRRIARLCDHDHFAVHDFLPADDFIATWRPTSAALGRRILRRMQRGTFGEYLRYNSPHRASFYLRACCPWSSGATPPSRPHRARGPRPVRSPPSARFPPPSQPSRGAVCPHEGQRAAWADRLDRGESAAHVPLRRQPRPLPHLHPLYAPNRPRPCPERTLPRRGDAQRLPRGRAR
jgi:hypothetical protein